MDFENLTPDDLKNSDILKYIHHVLFENLIVKGLLVCPNCNREYPIDDGIPNMILKDDEI
jgi:multifunctional methyltransferase subunit TRM112